MNRPGIDHIGVGVGVLILNDQGEILLALRGQKAKNERGKWEIPGGAVEFGETLEQALIREIKEEIGVEIKVIRLLKVADHLLPEEKQHWVAPTYLCKIVSGIPKVMEPDKCDRVEWFSFEDASKLPLASITIDDVLILKKMGKQNVNNLIKEVDFTDVPFAPFL